jgi:iron complex outermembrane recepter protein
VNITTQQYASAPVPGPLDAATSVAYSTPYERWHAGASIDYEWTTDHQVLASVRYGSTTLMSHNTVPYIPFRIALPAGAPGNPFGTTVLLTKAFWDIPIPQRDLESTSLAANLGVRGRWRADWRYEATLNFARSEAELLAEPLNLNVTRLNQALASGQPPVLAYDSTRVRNANAPGVIEGFADPAVLSEEVTDVWTYDIQVDGSVVELPSGAVRLAAGSEYREEYVDFPAQASNSPNPRGRNRYTAGVFAELFVPIVSERRSWPLLRGLDLRAAVRHDRYSDFAQSTTPNFGVLYRPFGKLLLRASYGEGYKLPTLSQLYAPVSSTLVSFPIGNPGFLDPLRDYTPVLLPPPAGRMPVTRGGNATLQPERSTNMTAGAVFDVPFVKGLSGSVGYFDTEYVDRAGAIPLTDRIALFPDTVVRGPRGPSEPAHWAGPVIGYEDKAMNIAYERLTGWDATVKYSVVTAVGEITAQSTASRITRRDVRTAPHLPPTTASTGDTYPLQSAGSLFLTRGKYDVGLMYAYRAKFRPSNLPTSRYTPSALRWDCQFSYSFAELSTDGPRATWWRRALDDVKVSVTIFNVLNDMPPLGPSTLPDNSVVDSRMRRYAVNLVKRF